MLKHRLAGMLAILVAVLAPLSAHAATGTLSGAVRYDEEGSPALAGALVRTEGQPGYSAVTGSDGSYSITMPQGTYSILVSSAGHNPQKTALSITGTPATRSFALRPATAGSAIKLPAPLDWGEPPSSPAPPGDSFPVSFVDSGALPDPDAPQISEWNETAKPDESFTMTGTGFTTRSGVDAGTDTIVWVWARTAAGGMLKQAKIWRVTESVITALLPDDIPFGMYLVWVENAHGASLPICLNRPVCNWVGPLGNMVQAGNKKRVLGKNMSYGHGTSTAYVYIQPTSGGDFVSCPVSTANPYMVEFTVPLGTANGSYKVYVHNGQGGVYGWGDGLDLTVQPDWVRGTASRSLSPSGGNDATAIQSAIDYLTAQPNGGTLTLSAGTFNTYSSVRLKSNVRVVGAGMDATQIDMRLNSPDIHLVGYGGNNISVESLTLKARSDTAFTCYGVIGGDYPTNSTYDMKFLNCRVTQDWGLGYTIAGVGNYRTEVAGCEFYESLSGGAFDAWVHDCNLYGGPYGVYVPYSFETEAALQIGERTIFEKSLVETKDWPVNPANGSRNYMDFITDWNSQLGFKVWAKRLVLGQYFDVSNTYCANLSAQDVAVQDNKGEMFLYHPTYSAPRWFGNVVSCDGLTVNLRTDGLVNGQAAVMCGLAGGAVVPLTDPVYGDTVGRDSITIVAGKGKGQARKLIAHSANSVTVDKPWRVQPDSTSVAQLYPMYTNNVVYNNDLNAFPVGYVQQYSSSVGVVFGGNDYHNCAENNTSRRTCSARMMNSNPGAPVYWNVMRDETAIDSHTYGFWMTFGSEWGPNPYGVTTLGNAYRNCQVNILDSADYGGATGEGEGNIFENMTITAKMGYRLYGAVFAGNWPDGFTLFRNGNVTVFDGPASPAAPEPVNIAATDGKQFLVSNSYSGSSQNYFLTAGLSSYSIPVALSKVARYSGYAGSPVPDQMISVANAGIAAMTWSVTPSDPWITARIQANGLLGAESTLGRLVVGVDTTGMTAGRHWGSVTISTSASSCKVGVCVDLASGTPPNSLPTASFIDTPAAGTAALTVSFDATASFEPDGSIASYSWDFGDGSYGSGVTASHSYATPNTYTPTLTITDNSGGTASSWTNVGVYPALSAVTLSGSPVGTVNTGSAVTLTAAATGGYQVQYKFMVNSGNGWVTLRDYQTDNTYLWTPAVAGYYEVKVYARNTGSTKVYDVTSQLISYSVGLLPTGARLWLKADAGLSKDGSGLVSSWADQSGTGNNVSQMASFMKPTSMDGAINSRPIVRFTGPGQLLQATGQVLSGNTSFTAFTVGRINQIVASQYEYFWFNGSDSSFHGYGCYLYTNGYMRNGWGSNSNRIQDTAPTVPGTLCRICSRFNSSSGLHEMWSNGYYTGSNNKSGSDLSGGTFTLGNFGPSAGSGLYGDIAEMMIYDRALTDTERANVDQYLTSRWVPPSAISVDRIKDVKALGDGVLVSITSAKVAISASGVYSDGSIYVTETDRTCGMKVTGAGTVNLFDSLTLAGTTDTDVATGERVLRVTSVSKTGGADPGVLGMGNRAFSATGQLARVWGKVKDKTGTCFTVDDGSGVPVKVETDGLAAPLSATPNAGDYVSASGPAGLMAGGIPAVRVRSDSDIRVY